MRAGIMPRKKENKKPQTEILYMCVCYKCPRRNYAANQ